MRPPPIECASDLRKGHHRERTLHPYDSDHIAREARRRCVPQKVQSICCDTPWGPHKTCICKDTHATSCNRVAGCLYDGSTIPRPKARNGRRQKLPSWSALEAAFVGVSHFHGRKGRRCSTIAAGRR